MGAARGSMGDIGNVSRPIACRRSALRAQSDLFSIGYYAEADLTFTPHVAKAFTGFDRFFCSLLASTYPNREHIHAGQSYGMTDNSLPFSP